MNKSELYKWSLNVAIVGAILYFVSGIYFGYAGHDMFRGAWALRPFVIDPWYMLMGAMFTELNPADEKRTRISGIIAAVLMAVYVVWYALPTGAQINYVYSELLLLPNYTVYPFALAVIGYWREASGKMRLKSIQSVAVIILSLSVYLVCEYFLWGWTARDLGLPGWLYSVMRGLKVIGITVGSLGILDYCMSEFALRITGVKWLRIVLIVICAYIWLRYTFSANWRWPGYAICRSINPVTVGISYLMYRSSCKLSKRLGSRNEE